jgi:hypothetical protein
MSEEKFSNYYTYLSNEWKKDFAGMYSPQIDMDEIMDWNMYNDLELAHCQMDDLLHIQPEILEEWGKL